MSASSRIPATVGMRPWNYRVGAITLVQADRIVSVRYALQSIRSDVEKFLARMRNHAVDIAGFVSLDPFRSAASSACVRRIGTRA